MTARKRSPIADEIAVLEKSNELIRKITAQLEENNRTLDRILGRPVPPKPTIRLIRGGRDA